MGAFSVIRQAFETGAKRGNDFEAASGSRVLSGASRSVNKLGKAWNDATSLRPFRVAEDLGGAATLGIVGGLPAIGIGLFVIYYALGYVGVL